MSLIRCPNGHYYDDSRYTSCPSCGIALDGLFGEMQAFDAEEKTVCRMDVNDDAVTVSKSLDQEVKTIAKFRVDNGTQPVVGWLVCVERGDKADIRFYNDEQISRGVHFLIIYDPKQNQFFLTPGEGTITKLNGEVLTQPQELKPYDRIEAGITAFDFIPYCIGGHHW